jgi:Tol biopolymer transport system component
MAKQFRGGRLSVAVAVAIGTALPAWAGTTERVSIETDGGQANDSSGSAVLSADGRFVAFSSNASNLVPGDTNGANDVFIRDRQAGTTKRVSIKTDSGQANDSSGEPALSADGRFVAFTSHATNLVPGDTNGWADVFVHRR